MEKKYILTDETKEVKGHTLHRIRAIVDFGNICEGELGGFVEYEDTLSHDGDCWIDEDVCVLGDSYICGDIQIYGNVVIVDSCIYGNDDSEIYDDVEIFNSSIVAGGEIHDNCKIYNTAINTPVHLSHDANINGSGDYIFVKGFGSADRDTTFFKCDNELIRVNCGCFSGTIDEFEEAVKRRHSERVPYREEYLNIARAVRIHFMKIQEYQNSIDNPPKKDTIIDKLFKKILKIQ